MTESTHPPALVPGQPPRLLVLVRGPEPTWQVCTITDPGDSRAAVLDAAGRPADMAEVIAWARDRCGRSRIELWPAPGSQAWILGEVPLTGGPGDERARRSEAWQASALRQALSDGARWQAHGNHPAGLARAADYLELAAALGVDGER